MASARNLEPVTDRDYAAEMRAVIDAETGEGPYVSRQVASHIVAKLRATDPDLLAGWLEAQAEHFVWQAINDRDRSKRAHSKTAARRLAFADAAEEFASGNPAPLTKFLAMPFVVADGNRKALATLTRDDLTFCANDYAGRAAENAMTAAFLRSLAKKVGRGVVADKFSEEQLASMWGSLSR